MVTGSPGGRTIINTVLEIVLDATTFGMDARQAVDAPRFHHQWLPDEVTFERNAIPDSTAQALTAMGYIVKFGGQQGDGNSIIIRDGVAYGANDTGAPIRRWPRRKEALEFALLHDLEQLRGLGVLLSRSGPASHVERRVIGLAGRALRLGALACVFFTNLASCFSSIWTPASGRADVLYTLKVLACAS